MHLQIRSTSRQPKQLQGFQGGTISFYCIILIVGLFCFLTVPLWPLYNCSIFLAYRVCTT
ncbi:hypothetical protein P389DRAFT_98608 [Cystobasidium minutum MCA 4210]|uniref:uncharacterized protein n=1 Tax=Cystobasidium minutum MCA 4210 TaxID=1397322 RepID=UPI0034CEE5EC|eukprot:jgi/Rhomi1/98608/CE98607_54